MVNGRKRGWKSLSRSVRTKEDRELGLKIPLNKALPTMCTKSLRALKQKEMDKPFVETDSIIQVNKLSQTLYGSLKASIPCLALAYYL